nr:MAG TPA: hypothetical protein [Caudoviricetes sp.]
MAEEQSKRMLLERLSYPWKRSRVLRVILHSVI